MCTLRMDCRHGTWHSQSFCKQTFWANFYFLINFWGQNRLVKLHSPQFSCYLMGKPLNYCVQWNICYFEWSSHIWDNLASFFSSFWFMLSCSQKLKFSQSLLKFGRRKTSYWYFFQVTLPFMYSQHWSSIWKLFIKIKIC